MLGREKKTTKFETEIEFGKEYHDRHTGFAGVATAVYFFEHGCTRVQLVALVEGKVEEYVFDEQALVETETSEPVESPSPAGGPRPEPGPRSRSVR